MHIFISGVDRNLYGGGGIYYFLDKSLGSVLRTNIIYRKKGHWEGVHTPYHSHPREYAITRYRRV